MNTPPPDDRPPPSPAAPEVLEYERPATGALAGRPTLSAVAVAAFAVGLVGAGGSMLLGRQVFTYQPLVRLELLVPLLAMVGTALSVNALLRIADRKNNLSGDPLAWLALFLNTACLLASGCCVSLRWLGTVVP